MPLFFEWPILCMVMRTWPPTKRGLLSLSHKHPLPNLPLPASPHPRFPGMIPTPSSRLTVYSSRVESDCSLAYIRPEEPSISFSTSGKSGARDPRCPAAQRRHFRFNTAFHEGFGSKTRKLLPPSVPCLTRRHIILEKLGI